MLREDDPPSCPSVRVRRLSTGQTCSHTLGTHETLPAPKLLHVPRWANMGALLPLDRARCQTPRCVILNPAHFCPHHPVRPILGDHIPGSRGTAIPRHCLDTTDSVPPPRTEGVTNRCPEAVIDRERSAFNAIPGAIRAQIRSLVHFTQIMDVRVCNLRCTVPMLMEGRTTRMASQQACMPYRARCNQETTRHWT